MLIYPSHGREKGEKDWEIVPSDWWRTSYTAVSWVYSQDEAKKVHHPQYTGSLFLWPLTGRRRASPSTERRGDGDVSLNVDLAGVKAALDPVVSYERNVGFHYKLFPDFEPRELEALIAIDLLSRVINEDDTRAHQVRWNELLENLMRAPLPEANDSDESSELGASCSSLGDMLFQSTSTLSSIDLTSSDGSFESFELPSTPRAKNSQNHNVEIKDISPTGSVTGSLHISPVRSLNASASLFIPPKLNDEPTQFPSLSSIPVAPSKLPSFADFTFPTLNPPVSSSAPSARLKKDSEGFFTEDNNNNTATATPLLPPFLQEPSHRSGRTRKSRTREIVDRLRSESGPNEDSPHSTQKIRNVISPKYASYSPSPLLNDFPQPTLIKTRRSVSEDRSGEHRRSACLASTSLSVSAAISRFSSPEAEDDDGWIDVANPMEKSTRTRDLFLALTRRRTNSVSSEALKDFASANNSTSDATDVGGEEGTSTNTSMSLSSASPPSTPPPLSKSANLLTSPTQARNGPVISSDGWIESPSAAQETSPKVLKEKPPKKDTSQKTKAMHNHNNHNHGQLNPWTRGSIFQPSLPLGPLHPPQLQPTAYNRRHPHVLSPHHPHPHSHVMPHTAAPPPPPPPGTAPIPYFFPSYPTVAMPVNMPISPMAYSTNFNVLHVPNAYPMPPTTTTTQTFGAPPPPLPPPSGYSHIHTNNLMSSAKAPSLTTPANTNIVSTVTAMPMPVPVGVGYSGMNTNRKVATGW